MSEPDKPWYTLNLDVEKGTVIQNRGLKNCVRTPEVEAFEKRWLTEVVEPWTAAGKNGLKEAKEKERKARQAKERALRRKIAEEVRRGAVHDAAA